MKYDQQAIRGLERLAREISEGNRKKGFKPITRRNADQKLLLVVGELVEAQEELRDGRRIDEIYEGEGGKPEGFPVEVVDALIRILDILGAPAMRDGIFASTITSKKLEFNATRKPKHGRKF